MTSERREELKRPVEEPGVTVKSRFCESGTGRVVCASIISRRLARRKMEPTEAVRAARDRAADTDDKAELKRAGSEGWNPSVFNVARIPDMSQRVDEVTSS